MPNFLPGPVAVVCLLAILAVPVSLCAAEETYEAFNFAFEFPAGEDWVRLPDRRLKQPVLFRKEVKNEALGRMVTVVVLRTTPTATLRNQEYVRGLKTGILKQAQGMRIASEVLEPYAGADGLALWLDRPHDGMTVRIHQVHVLSDSMHYVLTARALGGAATVDADLERLLAGFRFLTPPTPAQASGAHSIGYLIGYYCSPFLLIALFLVLVFRLRRRSAA